MSDKPNEEAGLCKECNGTKKMKILGGELIDCNCTRLGQSPSEPSCDHDAGLSWNRNKTWLIKACEPTCPFCKPPADKLADCDCGHDYFKHQAPGSECTVEDCKCDKFKTDKPEDKVALESRCNELEKAIAQERQFGIDQIVRQQEIIAEKDKRIDANRLYGYRDGKKEMEDEVNKLKNELYRIRCVAERLRDSDDENEISVEENIAGKYMLKVLDGENFS